MQGGNSRWLLVAQDGSLRLEVGTETVCPRCRGTHAGLTWKPLAFPVRDAEGGLFATHWVACPVNGEPFLLYSVPEDRELVHAAG